MTLASPAIVLEIPKDREIVRLAGNLLGLPRHDGKGRGRDGHEVEQPQLAVDLLVTGDEDRSIGRDFVGCVGDVKMRLQAAFGRNALLGCWTAGTHELRPRLLTQDCQGEPECDKRYSGAQSSIRLRFREHGYSLRAATIRDQQVSFVDQKSAAFSNTPLPSLPLPHDLPRLLSRLDAEAGEDFFGNQDALSAEQSHRRVLLVRPEGQRGRA
jgi:hypothetical protein